MALSTESETGTQNFRSPTIKGIFVNSHVDAVRRALGEEGIRALEDHFGAPVGFRARDDVAVRDEVRIIEGALDLLSKGTVPTSERAFEAGRLHFRNFTTTPWAKILFTVFPKNFAYMMRHAGTIAERVFKGVTFRTDEIGPTHFRVVMDHNDYPIDHFRGLFYEWMRYFDLDGDVTATVTGPGRYEYEMRWE